MGLGNWMLKRGLVGQTTKIVAKMYVNSKLKEPDKSDIYHLIGVLFIRWMIVPAPGNKERFRSVMPEIRASLEGGNHFGLLHLILFILGSEMDIRNIMDDVILAVSEVLRSEGIPERYLLGASVDEDEIEFVFSEFSV